MSARLAALALSLVVLAGSAAGSDVPTARHGVVGHPRSRFPLAVHVVGAPGAALEQAVRAAVEDWNPVAVEALGVPAFRWADGPDAAQVVVRFTAEFPGGARGQTRMDADDAGVLRLPVSIDLAPLVARGKRRRSGSSTRSRSTSWATLWAFRTPTIRPRSCAATGAG